MASSYSGDLRDRVIQFVDQGHSRRSAARRFGVSASFAVKLVARWRRTGSSAPGRRGGARRDKLGPHRDFILARVEEAPDITMAELAAELSSRGVSIDPSSLSRFLCKAGFTYKKNPAGRGTRTRRCASGADALEDGAPAWNAT